MSHIEIYVNDGDGGDYGYGGNNGGGGNNGTGMAALIIVIGVIAGVAFFFGKPLLAAAGGGGGDDAPRTDPASVSISGAKPCKTSPGGRYDNVNLTRDRLPTCVQAKKYAKAVLVDTYKRDAEKQFKCLDQLWTNESQWSAWAKNPSSAAFGIAQIHPGVHKTSIKLGDWKGQVHWGLEYINGRYKTPCAAWEFWLAPTVKIPGASKHWY